MQFENLCNVLFENIIRQKMICLNSQAEMKPPKGIFQPSFCWPTVSLPYYLYIYARECAYVHIVICKEEILKLLILILGKRYCICILKVYRIHQIKFRRNVALTICVTYVKKVTYIIRKVTLLVSPVYCKLNQRY